MLYKLYYTLVILVTIIVGTSSAYAGTYDLHIAKKPVTIAGKTTTKITVNDSLPGPTLRFTDGEDVTINVYNHLDEDTSVHWHGLYLPAAMDGVPGLNGFPGIKPHTMFTYRFKIRQTGTYWYHAHTVAQEQDGLYGSIVIKPKGKDPIASDRDYVIVISDYQKDSGLTILHNLKKSSDYYQYAKETFLDFLDKIKKQGFMQTVKDEKMWQEMRMYRTDLSDVTGYHFLVNGHDNENRWLGLAKPRETIRLRFINASAMSIYDLRIPGLKLNIVTADGQRVKPVTVDELRIGPAETYDIIVRPKTNEAYTIVAESIDRTGFALGTLAPREDMKGVTPTHRPRSLLTMTDMGMAHAGINHQGMQHHDMMESSGWALMHAPKGTKILSYQDLKSFYPQKDLRKPVRSIDIRLGGNMERYIWTMNGDVYGNATPITFYYGERVRIRLINESMMAHPMHLHGMFMQLENGQTSSSLPNKHTVIVPPGQTVSVLVSVTEPGQWAFHCHLLFHMLSGMMQHVNVLDKATNKLTASATN